MFRDVAVDNHLHQKEVIWMPLLSITDAIHLHADFIELMQAGYGGLAEGLAGEKMRYERDDLFGMLSRINPMFGAFLATGTETDLLRGRPFKVEVIPSWYIEMDFALTGGIIAKALGARRVTADEYKKLDYPGQTEVWVASNKKVYWLWRNMFHLGPLGGRGVQQLESFYRADVDVVEAMVASAWQYHDSLVRLGLKDEVVLPDWYKRHSEVGGAKPRKGYTEFGEFMSGVGFRGRMIPTPEAAAQRVGRDSSRAIREAKEEQEPR